MQFIGCYDGSGGCQSVDANGVSAYCSFVRVDEKKCTSIGINNNSRFLQAIAPPVTVMKRP